MNGVESRLRYDNEPAFLALDGLSTAAETAAEPKTKCQLVMKKYRFSLMKQLRCGTGGRKIRIMMARIFIQH